MAGHVSGAPSTPDRTPTATGYTHMMKGNGTAVNDTYQTTTKSPSGAQPDGLCSACRHPLADHDRIAARFCSATTVGHHDRGCVCTAVQK